MASCCRGNCNQARERGAPERPDPCSAPSSQDFGKGLIVHDRNRRQRHDVAPTQGKLCQGLGILCFQQGKPAAEIGSGPAPKQLDAGRRLTSRPLKSSDTLRNGLWIRRPIEGDHDHHFRFSDFESPASTSYTPLARSRFHGIGACGLPAPDELTSNAYSYVTAAGGAAALRRVA